MIGNQTFQVSEGLFHLIEALIVATVSLHHVMHFQAKRMQWLTKIVDRIGDMLVLHFGDVHNRRVLHFQLIEPLGEIHIAANQNFIRRFFCFAQ